MHPLQEGVEAAQRVERQGGDALLVAQERPPGPGQQGLDLARARNARRHQTDSMSLSCPRSIMLTLSIQP